MRFLGKYGVPLEALQAQDDSALNELLKNQIPPAVEESFAHASAALVLLRGDGDARECRFVG
jgi:hypothetical protein